MPLFHKPTEDITFEDVEEFCRAQHPESMILDYKEDFPKKGLERTIAAMANTHGGLILVGVAEDGKTSRPVLPLKGVQGRRFAETINSIVLNNVHPPVFPQVQRVEIPPSQPNAGRSVVLVRIHESDITPHTTDRGARTYIRAPGQSKPYDAEAALGRVEWLLNRRQKSVELREHLRQKAEDRFWAYVKPHDPQEFASWQQNLRRFVFHAAPLYPYERVADPPRLLEWLDRGFPQSVDDYVFGNVEEPGETMVVAGGARETGGKPKGVTPEGRRVWSYVSYLELDSYGGVLRVLHETPAEYKDGCCSNQINAQTVLKMVAGWLRYSLGLWREFGFEGLARVELSLHGTRNQEVLERAAVRHRCPDKSVMVHRTALVREFRGRFQEMLEGMHREWLEGFTYAIGDLEMQHHLRHIVGLTPDA